LWLILRPVKSLHVLVITIAVGTIAVGATKLLGDEGGRWPRLLGLAWVVVGLGVLFWPGLTLHALSL
jgi:hypothetical protein